MYSNHLSPYHIAFKESWEAGIQASHFARELGCPTMDKVCMREKTFEEVMDAKGRTNAIVNKDKLFLAAVQWGPTIDGKFLKQQPFEALRNGDYDTTKNIITGMTTHESEIFVRGVFDQPMNDFGVVGGVRALFHALDNGNELLTRIFQGYNMAYDGNGEFPEMNFPECNSTIGDWSPVLSLPGVEAGHVADFFLPKYSKISDFTRGSWDGMLTADDQVTNENCEDRCKDSLTQELCAKICSKVNICDISGKKIFLMFLLTRGDRDMSVKVPFCRGFLDHSELTLTNKTFQLVSLDYYLHTEQKMRSKKGHPTDFWPIL